VREGYAKGVRMLEMLLSSAPFATLGAAAIAMLAALYFTAFAIKGALGLGSLTPTIVFGALVVDAHHAVALALMANILSQLQYVPAGFRHGDWSIAGKVIVPNFVAAAAGVWIFGQISSAELTLLLGVALGLLVLFDISGTWSAIASRVDITRLGAVTVMSAVAGFVSGVTGAGGLLLLAVYLRLVKPDKADFRATMLLLSTLVVGWRAVVMIYAGQVDAQTVAESLLLAPVIVLGGVFGTLIYGRLPERQFTLALQFVILFGAVILIWRGLAQTFGASV
jgi:uncharacterized membrane protein YfcA